MDREYILKKINDILWNDFINEKSFFNKYRSVEVFAFENGLTGTIYEYNFPDKNKSSLKIESFSDGLCITVNTPDGVWKMGYEKTPKQLYEACEQLKKILIKYSLLYSPKVTNDFINELNQIKENEIIDFNTRLSVVCLKNTDSELIFKKQFEGKLDSLKINDFQHAETFTINKNNKNDYQSLFSNAYDYRSNTCNIRRRLQSKDGYDILQEIESKLNENDVFVKDIGPIQLKIAKQNNKIIWYDTNNCVINRDDVATLFSWAKNINIDYRTVNVEKGLRNITPEIQNQVNTTFLQEIKSASNNLDEMINKAFNYSNTLYFSALSISGLKDDGGHNFNSCTFVFTQGKIIKIDYFNGSFSNDEIKSIGEVSKEEFKQFMEQKHENVIKEINQECKMDYEEFQRIHPHLTKEEAADFVQRTMAKKIERLKNPYSFSEEKLNHMEEVTEKLVQNYINMKNSNRFSLQQLFQIQSEEKQEVDCDKELS